MASKEGPRSEALGFNENHHSRHRRHHRFRDKPPVLGLVFAFLVTVFIICSFTFTIFAFVSKDWAHRELLVPDDQGGTYNLIVPRSPRFNCHIEDTGDHPHPPVPTFGVKPRATGNSTSSPTTATTNSTSTNSSNVSSSAVTGSSPSRPYAVDCSIPLCDPLSDNPNLCQKLTFSRNLLYASVALITTSLVLSVAMLGVLPAPFAVITTRSKPFSSSSRALSTWISPFSFITYLFLVASVAVMITCHYFGFSATVDQQFPDGNSITQVGSTPPSGEDPTDSLTVPWVAGKGSIWMGLAWGFAALAVLGWQGVWGIGSFQLATAHPRRWKEEEEHEEETNESRREE
ncbi:hypothetical protein CNMCM5793_006130 [Aspergillus hiratsukae]|uniref:Uncharacterized protein n=1 Tax=Aspergillus hiratsukae TaxID=1194566 RepID=A0A8H6UZM3_9EURO|nr:hypothetical protein CNMCM5793_006130 [Aspergillus hiratsukae]KAF7172602.1 hypothetical protein CNMCM6106_006767 [Aspergillus hiratsukae]